MEVKSNVDTLTEVQRTEQVPNPVAVDRPRRRAAMDGELLRRLRS